LYFLILPVVKTQIVQVWSSFLGKILIEEAVENRVRTGAGHTHHVTDEESQHELT
jgi:hypothetical protein